MERYIDILFYNSDIGLVQEAQWFIENVRGLARATLMQINY